MLTFALIFVYIYHGVTQMVVYSEYSSLEQCQSHIAEAVAEFRQYNPNNFLLSDTKCISMEPGSPKILPYQKQ